MPWTEYLKLTFRDRWDLNMALNDLIEETTPEESPGVRPKQMRK